MDYSCMMNFKVIAESTVSWTLRIHLFASHVFAVYLRVPEAVDSEERSTVDSEERWIIRA